MRIAALPREDLLSVEETADRLDITDREVFNLVKSGKLLSEKIDGRRWISLVEINRYRLIHKNSYIDHAFSLFPSAAAPNFQNWIVFGPWGETGDYPQFELEVTLGDWMRFAAKHITKQSEYEKIRTELRDRIGPGTPENFAVRFKINQADLAAVLKGAIHRVKVPKLPSFDDEEIRSMAMEHLVDHALLRINRVTSDPSDYLAKSVTNYYIDLQRAEYSRTHPEIAFGGPDEIEVALGSATRRLTGRKPKRKPHK